jgi:hypothetical protein
MRIGSALLVGTTALALAFGAGSALAKAKHHQYRHHAARPAAVHPPQAAVDDTSLHGNNPAKRYKAVHDANASADLSLSLSGNNPTKRYKAVHGSNLRMEPTLSRYGNNGVKYYPTRTQ